MKHSICIYAQPLDNEMSSCAGKPEQDIFFELVPVRTALVCRVKLCNNDKGASFQLIGKCLCRRYELN